MARRGEEMVAVLQQIADQELTGTSQRALRQAIREIENRDILLEVMGDFIESEYRAEFEETLDLDTQDLYREHFELDHDDTEAFDWPAPNGREWEED